MASPTEAMPFRSGSAIWTPKRSSRALTSSTRSSESTSSCSHVVSGCAVSASGTLIAVSSARMASRISCWLAMVMVFSWWFGFVVRSLLGAQAAVDGEGRPVDVRRLVADEEGHRGGDLLGLADAGGRDDVGEFLRGQLGGHLGRDEAGRHGVGCDVALGHLLGHHTREAQQAGLGGRVVGLA